MIKSGIRCNNFRGMLDGMIWLIMQKREEKTAIFLVRQLLQVLGQKNLFNFPFVDFEKACDRVP